MFYGAIIDLTQELHYTSGPLEGFKRMSLGACT